MPRVHCSLPNASDEISGIKFVSHADGGKVSEDISAERAADLASIPGYTLVEAEKAATGPVDAAAGSPASADDDLAQLRARGVELNIPHAVQMGAKRLRDAVADAEAKAAKSA